MNLLLILGAWLIVATVFTLIWGALCNFSEDSAQEVYLEQKTTDQNSASNGTFSA